MDLAYPKLKLRAVYLLGISIFSNTFHMCLQPVQCSGFSDSSGRKVSEKILTGASGPCDYIRARSGSHDFLLSDQQKIKSTAVLPGLQMSRAASFECEETKFLVKLGLRLLWLLR